MTAPNDAGGWEAEFDRRHPSLENKFGAPVLSMTGPETVKDFIRNLIAQEREAVAKAMVVKNVEEPNAVPDHVFWNNGWNSSRQEQLRRATEMGFDLN